MKHKTLKKISFNIRKIMKEKETTGVMLTVQTGLSIMTISNTLTCRSEPRISTLAAIADVLKVDIRDLLDGIKTEEMI